jgi:hypothetical protein
LVNLQKFTFQACVAVQLDVDAQVVGVELQLIPRDQPALFVDGHGEGGHPSVDVDPPVPIAAGIDTEVDVRRRRRGRGPAVVVGAGAGH